MTPILPESKYELIPTPQAPSPDWLERARRAILDDAGHALYKQFWLLHREGMDDKGSAAKEAMLTLERLWDCDQLVAGYLMALLLTDAASASRHDIVDAIWLYLENSSSQELASALERATVKRGRQLKPKFATVVSKIRARVGA